MKTQAGSRFTLRPRTIRGQLIGWNVLTLVLLLAVFGVVIHFMVRSFMMISVDHELDRRTHQMLDIPPPPFPGSNPNQQGPAPGPPPPEPREGVGRPGPPADRSDGANQWLRARTFDANAKPINATSADTPYDRAALLAALRQGDLYTNIVLNGEPVRLLSRRFPARGGAAGVVQAPYPLTDVQRALAGLDSSLLMLIPFAMVFAWMGGYLLTNRVLRPVRSITQTAQQITVEGLSNRLSVRGEDEFANLATTFNQMLARLEEAFQHQERLMEDQRRFISDASHELRTPLTVIKANTSLCAGGATSAEDYRQSITDIDRAATAMSSLVHDLLLLSKADEGRIGANRIVIPVAEVVSRAAALIPKEGTAVISIEAEDTALCVQANEDEMIRVFRNLLENAARYTPYDGSIRVCVAVDGDMARINVTDSGKGIPEVHLARLTERFYRVDSARSRPDGGTGLGLAICKSIVEAHGGTMMFASQVGVGTTVTVQLPIVRPTDEQ